MNIIEKVLNLVEVEYTQSHTHYILTHCPNCGGENKLHVDKHKKLWICFKCVALQESASSGNFYSFLKNVLQLDSFQIKSVLKDEEIASYTPEFLELKVEEKKEETQETYQPFSLPSFYYPLDCSKASLEQFPEAYEYLSKRHVTDESRILNFNLRYDPAKKRLVFPCYSDKNTCLGYQARDITERWKHKHPACINQKCHLNNRHYFFKEDGLLCPTCKTPLKMLSYAKSMNSKNFPKHTFFYNQQNVDWSKPVTIVEGPFDCINTPNSIALLGKFLSASQFDILMRLAKTLVIYLDADESGLHSAIDLYYKINLHIPNITFAYINEGDPGQRNIHDNTILISNAIPADKWFALHNQILF